MSSAIRAVLFDLDGTLVDTHFLIHRCLDESLQHAAGLRFDEQWWQEGAGKPLHILFPIALEKQGRTDISVDALIVDYRTRLRSYESEVRLFPGVSDMLNSIERLGLRMSIVTTKHSEAAVRHLASVGLTGRFETVMTGDKCDHYKPHPDPFNRVVNEMSLEPAHCVSIGDSPGDMHASRAAGIISVAAMWGCLDRTATIDVGPDHVIESPGDLEALLIG